MGTFSSSPSPTFIDGIRCYAPELAHGNDYYDAKLFDLLFQTEARNFWFRSRNRLIRRLVERWGDGRETTFLEVGCGTGFVLQGLASLPHLKLTGAEIHIDGLRYARQRLPNVEFVQLDVTRMPLESAYDMVGAFDVLEHIEDDRAALAGLSKVLKPEGIVFLTVPQHPGLWSSTDTWASHKRRYTRAELCGKLTAAGFQILSCTSFVFFLAPLYWIFRYFSKPTDKRGELALHIPGLALPRLLNGVLEGVMWLEEILIHWGISLPFGGSLLVAARKNPAEPRPR